MTKKSSMRLNWRHVVGTHSKIQYDDQADKDYINYSILMFRIQQAVVPRAWYFDENWRKESKGDKEQLHHLSAVYQALVHDLHPRFHSSPLLNLKL